MKMGLLHIFPLYKIKKEKKSYVWMKTMSFIALHIMITHRVHAFDLNATYFLWRK